MNDAVAARKALESALDEIEDRINPVKIGQRAGVRIGRSYRRNPEAWTIGASAVVAVAGAALFLVLRRR